MITTLKGAIGIIQAVNVENYTATVKLLEYEDKITGHLSILSPLTYQNKEVHIPKVNTPVFCIFIGAEDERDISHGFIIGGWFSDNNKSGSTDGVYNLDFQNSTLKINENGTIDITAKNTNITSKTTINGDLDVTGKVNINDALKVGKTINAQEDIQSEKLVKGKDFIKI